jgi:hypothetical protein
MSNELIVVANSGQAVRWSNYWDSDYARVGYCFLSWNAGAARLLIPDILKPVLREMRGADHVIVSRGPWQDGAGRDALELLFEDRSNTPFFLILDAAQTDRILPAADSGHGFMFTAWTRAGEQLRMDGLYRIVSALPCLDPWHGCRPVTSAPRGG